MLVLFPVAPPGLGGPRDAPPPPPPPGTGLRLGDDELLLLDNGVRGLPIPGLGRRLLEPLLVLLCCWKSPMPAMPGLGGRLSGLIFFSNNSTLFDIGLIIIDLLFYRMYSIVQL